MEAFCDGAALLLGALLLSAGALKMARPAAFAHALYRLLPEELWRRSLVARAAAPTVACLELATGAALAGSPWWPPAVATTAAIAGASLFTGFVVVVSVAIRKGAACGCWSSFSDGPAGGSELGRAVTLATVAAVGLALRLAAAVPRGWLWASVAWSVSLATTVLLAIAGGGRLRPLPARTEALAVGRLRPAVEFALGRVTSKLAGLDLPVVTTLRGDALTLAVADVRRTPTWHAFENWLGERAGRLDWKAATARRSTAAGDVAWRDFVRVELPLVDGVRVSASVPLQATDGRDATVFGIVDGRVVTAAHEQVAVREQPAARLQPD